MTRAGLPVPPGFVVTTEACNAFFANGKKFPEGLWDQVKEGLLEIEKKVGKRFGDPKNPLLVSVRSGAAFSMPGMMDTVLNLGLNEILYRGWPHKPETCVLPSTLTGALLRSSVKSLWVSLTRSLKE